MKISERYLYKSVSENRDKFDDIILLDEIRKYKSDIRVEFVREMWIEAHGTVTIYKFTIGTELENDKKYVNARKYNLSLAKMRKVLKRI